MRKIVIRKYKQGEEKQLLDIFRSSIRQNADAYYRGEQLEAWAPEDIDFKKWVEGIRGINPYVIIQKEEILGYADLQHNGYIDHFFVKGGQARKGIGKQLMEYLLNKAREREIMQLTSDVSLAAQDFFKKFGFEIVMRRKVLIRGVELENALMRRLVLDEFK